MRRKTNNIFQMLIIGTLTFFIAKFAYRRYKLNQCDRIVIARVYKNSGSPKTGITLSYKYNFKEQDYEGSMLINAEDFFTYNSKKRFFAKVPCETPSISTLVLDATVPDAILKNPTEGWPSIPLSHD